MSPGWQDDVDRDQFCTLAGGLIGMLPVCDNGKACIATGGEDQGPGMAPFT